jgi:GNAT superfamily N-acetyltransferase
LDGLALALEIERHCSADEILGRVRHLYVLSTSRRMGVGPQLVRRVIQAARGRFDELRLRTNNPAAGRFYEALGFGPSVDRGDYTHLAKLAVLHDKWTEELS